MLPTGWLFICQIGNDNGCEWMLLECEVCKKIGIIPL